MSGPIPEFIDPRRLADRGVALQGSISADRLPRLLAAVNAVTDEVIVELNFARDEQGLTTLHGHYQAIVEMTCQRCLEGVTLPLDSRCEVGFVVSDEAAKQLPRHYEPVIVDDEKLNLLSLIEEELLLALPAVPMHPLDKCQHPDGFEPDEEPEEEAAERPNPFSVLAKLKRDT
ncbi:MAG: metal-binding protein [Pseudomonadaceae bacterium]|nr:MAG: metal-binding protein [Pseudomonadaceae bacterium]